MRVRMPALLVVLATGAIACGGCSISVKTPIVADYARFDAMHGPDISRNEVELAVGSPQGTGVHKLGEEDLDLDFYYGLVGLLTYFPNEKARLDSGMAFASYSENKLAQLIYFNSKKDGPPIKIGREIPIYSVVSSIAVGVSPIEHLYEVLGEPDYSGRRINTGLGLEHSVVYYDGSQVQSDGALKERWLIVGFDSDGVVQDVAWASSFDEDLDATAVLARQTMQTFSRLDWGALGPVWQPTAIATDNPLDPTQVEALIRANPTQVSDFVSVLGRPSAMGLKSFKEHDPWVLSNWSYVRVDLEGRESGFIPPSRRADPAAKPKSYEVMDFQQARLLVAHTIEGSVTEVIWFAPPAGRP